VSEETPKNPDPATSSRGTHSGAVVHRWRMANDHFTQIHNLVLRGKTPIKTQYVGVWGFICSHVEGWRLTEAGIARELRVGRKFVRSALAAIEEAGCLIRVQERNADGSFGPGHWFITDLPIQLQQVGISDPALINERVKEAFEEWRAATFGTSEPMSPEGTSGATCGDPIVNGQNPFDEGQKRRSEPMSPQATSGRSTSGEGTSKKNKAQKTRGKNNQSTAGAVDGDERSSKDGAGADAQEGKHEEARKLLDRVRQHHAPELLLHEDYIAAVKIQLEAGYTADAIEAVLTQNLGRYQHAAAGVVVAVKNLPTLLEATQPSRQQGAETPPWCGECDPGGQYSPAARQVEDSNGRWRRCPRCHPTAVHATQLA